MNNIKLMPTLLFGLVLLLAGEWGSPHFSKAADHRNLEENHPTRIEDAYPISFRSFELQTRVGYANNGEQGDHAGEMENEFKWGVMKNAHVVLGVPLSFSESASTGNNGDVRLEGLYNFNVETESLPAFSFKTDLLFPGGEDSRGVDLELNAIATKGWGQNRFHFNGIYKRNSGRTPGQREHLYSLGVAFDRPLDLDHLVVVDFFADQIERAGAGPVFSFVTGFRKQINPWSVMTFGVGHGFGEPEAADFFATLGFQINF